MAAVAGHLLATELLQFYDHADVTVKCNPDIHCSLWAIRVFSLFFFFNGICLEEVGYLDVQRSSAFVLSELWCVDIF